MHAANFPSGISYDYNVSHDSDVVVLAAATSASTAPAQVGVDVMRIAVPWDGGSTEEFIETMGDQLDTTELQVIRSAATEEARLGLALAFWTLKEAYIKAIGEGLHFDLRQLRFDLDDVQDGDLASSTNGRAGQAFVDGIEAVGWRFRLAKVAGRTGEEDYWLASAWCDKNGRGEVELRMEEHSGWLHVVTLDELLVKAEPVSRSRQCQ
ncbi:hypothetical protein JCM10295v2_003781 [Rhodotorula toruloides]